MEIKKFFFKVYIFNVTNVTFTKNFNEKKLEEKNNEGFAEQWQNNYCVGFMESFIGILYK